MTATPRRAPWDLEGAPPPTDQEPLRIHLEKRRYQKPVTIVAGLAPQSDGEGLARTLKKALAAGGTFREGVIELQGDHRQRLPEILRGLGFRIEEPR